MADPVFLVVDFEASSLALNSFPIEVGWCDLDGVGESYLILPEPDWLDWDTRSEEVHGISRDMLRTEGRPAKEVGSLYSNAGRGAYLFADGGPWDQGWSDQLLRAAGLRRQVLFRIQQLYALALRPLLETMPSHLRPSIATKLVHDAEQAATEKHPAVHRALEDARRLAATHGALAARVAELLS